VPGCINRRSGLFFVHLYNHSASLYSRIINDVFILVLLMMAYIKQGKIVKEMEREERIEKEKAQMNES
jgi:hypothetical protein